ncbi:MAG: hypothetical protein CM1200mP18_22720 [Gammaproteobacteria bacterium]|nr:MAG: hypothetical protein CM1200mP18_22720 [Gammaproteobacteria bacterium]
MGGDYVLIGWLILDATQSSSWVGIAFALYYLPNIIFGIVGGGIADRFPRRGLLQSLDLGASGLIILLSVLFRLSNTASTPRSGIDLDAGQSTSY